MDVEGELDRLYELPLDEFTAARNELAKRLRADGEREQAEEVRGLAKPTVAVWAVNQLARRRKQPLKALLDAADRLRKAQERALGGDGGEALRRAALDEREAVTALRREARDLLAEAGRPATDPTLERVATTLTAAARDPEARELLEAGRLAEEVEATGFEALAGLQPAPGGRQPARRRSDDRAEQRRQAAEARKRAGELRKRAAELEQEARRAEREAERAASEAERARAAADEARAEADAAVT